MPSTDMGTIMNRFVLETPVSVMEGANTVYLVRQGDTIALIDTGFPTQDVLHALTGELARYNVELTDLDAIFLTHGHPDHAGLAGVLQQESNATIYLHETDHPYVLQDSELMESFIGDQERFDTWGVPEDLQKQIQSAIEGMRDSIQASFDPPTEIDPIGDGQSINLGEFQLDVIHTPGHTQGSVVFTFDGQEGREAFTGDTLLPTYTANIGTDPRIENPLEEYFTALQTQVSDLTRAWPGHRDPITDPSTRVKDIIAHHNERMASIVDVLEETDALTVWEVTMHLFDNLQGVHAMLGASEIEAHLTYLQRKGLVEGADNAYRVNQSSTADLHDFFARYTSGPD